MRERQRDRERERERERQVVSPSVDCEPAQEEEAALSRLRYVIDSSPHTSPHTPALEMCVCFFDRVEVGMLESWDRGLRYQTEVEPVFPFNIDVKRTTFVKGDASFHVI